MLPIAHGFKSMNEAKNKAFKHYFPKYVIGYESSSKIFFINIAISTDLGYFCIFQNNEGDFSIYYLGESEYIKKLDIIIKYKLSDLIA